MSFSTTTDAGFSLLTERRRRPLIGRTRRAFAVIDAAALRRIIRSQGAFLKDLREERRWRAGRWCKGRYGYDVRARNWARYEAEGAQ